MRVDNITYCLDVAVSVFMMSSQTGNQGHQAHSLQSLPNFSGLPPMFPAPSGISAAPFLLPPFNTSTTPASLSSTPFPLFSMPQTASTPASSASTGQQETTENSNRTAPVQTLDSPTVGPMPPVMPMPFLHPHVASGPADFLPVDPYLPCHSRHFLARRAANAASQANAAHQVYFDASLC